MNTSPREAVFQSLLIAYRNEGYLSASLKLREYKDKRDEKLAQELAYGTMRMTLTLDAIAKKKSKLPKKLTEKILLRMSLYQAIYMDRIPKYAIVNEMVELAKIHTNEHFAKYLNYFLNNIPEVDLSNESLSVQYSFPESFVNELINDYGEKQAKEIMEALNLPSPTMARVLREKLRYITVKDPSVFQSSDYYIQNITPGYLINHLSLPSPPKKILDLCASPGGKLIAIHERFPSAKLFANDVSPLKINRLRENLEKYHIDAEVSCSKGEDYESNHLFDLIILDVPCSNSGVLNKRPEARWRLENIQDLEKTQKALVKKALTLLESDGQIWYMTCSILKRENENVIQGLLGVKMIEKHCILPNKEGWDGGFGSIIKWVNQH